MGFTQFIVRVLEIDARACSILVAGGAPRVIEYIDHEVLPKLNAEIEDASAAGSFGRHDRLLTRKDYILAARAEIEEHHLEAMSRLPEGVLPLLTT